MPTGIPERRDLTELIKKGQIRVDGDSILAQALQSMITEPPSVGAMAGPPPVVHGSADLAKLWSTVGRKQWAKLLDILEPKLTSPTDRALLKATRDSPQPPDHLRSDSAVQPGSTDNFGLN